MEAVLSAEEICDRLHRLAATMRRDRQWSGRLILRTDADLAWYLNRLTEEVEPLCQMGEGFRVTDRWVDASAAKFHLTYAHRAHDMVAHFLRPGRDVYRPGLAMRTLGDFRTELMLAGQRLIRAQGLDSPVLYLMAY